jgi:hypothetical protein
MSPLREDVVADLVASIREIGLIHPITKQRSILVKIAVRLRACGCSL